MFARIGAGELIVILIIALLVVGPERLPAAARSLGKAAGTMRHYMNETNEQLAEINTELSKPEPAAKTAPAEQAETPESISADSAADH